MSTRSLDAVVGFDLGRSLGYLVGQLSKQMTADLNARLAEHGLTTAQWAVLACLWGEDGLAQKEISTRTGIDPATLTEMLKRMSGRGLVRRERDPGNNRLQRVYLDGARPELRDEIAGMAAAVNATAFAGFDEQDRTRLLALLRRALSNTEQHRPT